MSFVIKQFSLDNIVLGKLGTGEASVALSRCRLHILEQKLVPQGGP